MIKIMITPDEMAELLDEIRNNQTKCEVVERVSRLCLEKDPEWNWGEFIRKSGVAKSFCVPEQG